MNHEELLQEVKSRFLHPAQDITNSTAWEHKAKLGYVLYGVIQLHKPENLAWCACDEPYPCTTISTIERLLND